MHPYGKVYIYIFPPKKILTDLKLSSLILEGDTDFSQNISITLIFDWCINQFSPTVVNLNIKESNAHIETQSEQTS